MTVENKEPPINVSASTLEARLARQETAEQARALIAAYGRVVEPRMSTGSERSSRRASC
jgi:hypothetical protein